MAQCHKHSALGMVVILIIIRLFDYNHLLTIKDVWWWCNGILLSAYDAFSSFLLYFDYLIQRVVATQHSPAPKSATTERAFCRAVCHSRINTVSLVGKTNCCSIIFGLWSAADWREENQRGRLVTRQQQCTQVSINYKIPHAKVASCHVITLKVARFREQLS